MRSVTAVIALVACLVASPASARNTVHDLEARAATESPLGAEKLLEVPFYLAGQKHPAVARDLGTFRSNLRTNAFMRSDEEACQRVFLSALISLQKRAIQQGGNAVVDIKSVTGNDELVSASEYRCAAGTFVANVALSGRVVTLK